MTHILFYDLKGKRYCIWATAKGFLTIHRKPSEEHGSMLPQTYSVDDFCVWSDPYWVGSEVHRLIERYESDSTANALAPEIESRLLAAAIDAPEWALDLTDPEIAEAMRLRKVIELIAASQTIADIRALLKAHAPLKGPTPLKGALICIAVIASNCVSTDNQAKYLEKIRGHAEDALRRVPRYSPGYPPAS